MSPAGFVPQHLVLMEGQYWAQAQVTVSDMLPAQPVTKSMV